MSLRAASALAWSLWALSVALAASAVSLFALTRSVQIGDVRRDVALVAALSFLAYSTVGALIVSRLPGNRIGWLFLVAGLSAELLSAAEGYAAYALLVEPGSLPGGVWAAWLRSWGGVLSYALAATFLLLLFPTGRLPSRRWRPVAWLAGASLLLVAVGAAFAPGDVQDFPATNPVGIEALSLLDSSGFAWFGFMLSIPASVACAVVRFRKARGDERQQLKWFAASALLLVVFLLGLDSASPLALAAALASLGLPVATGIAIFKYRLYDLDLIIRRTLVYGVLSALLAGLYFGIVIALQQVFSSFAGGSDLAIAASTLAVAALFRPVRGRIQALVDRRFFRRRYDAQRTLEAFTAKLRDEIDLEALGVELRQVVQETMQPAHVSLWLREPE